MAADLFQSKGAVGGVYKGTLLAITLGDQNATGGTTIKGSLVQQVTVQYARTVNRIWELGSPDTYFILGHTQGNAGLSRIVGRADSDILDQLADACTSINKVLNLSPAGPAVAGDQPCPNSEIDFDLVLGGPVLTNRAFALSVDNFMATEQAGIMFVSLSKGRGNNAA